MRPEAARGWAKLFHGRPQAMATAARRRYAEVMAVERASAGGSLIDVLDRVLDKGIVVDAWIRLSVAGIDLITVEARVVVASIETYLRYSDGFAAASSAALPNRGTIAARRRAA